MAGGIVEWTGWCLGDEKGDGGCPRYADGTTLCQLSLSLTTALPSLPCRYINSIGQTFA